MHAALIKNGIIAYLPLLRTIKQWSDRKKWVEEPLFRSYLFVFISEKEYYEVLNTPGAVRYVAFEGKAVPVPEKQIEAIRYFLNEASPDILPGDMALEPGQAVAITRGPLHGLTGELVSIHGHKKVRVRIDCLGQYLHLTVSVLDIKAIEHG